MAEHEEIRPSAEEVRAAIEEEMSKSRLGRWALRNSEGFDRAAAMIEKDIVGSDLAREADGTLRITTPGPHWSMAIFAVAFLGFAAVFSVAGAVQGATAAAAMGVALLLVGGWGFFRLLARETFVVDHAAVSVRSAVGPLGRTRRIPVHEIARIEAATDTDGETQSRMTIRRTNGRSLNCGWVSEYEAAEIARLIEERLERLR